MSSALTIKKYFLAALVGLFFIIGFFGIPHVAHADTFDQALNRILQDQAKATQDLASAQKQHDDNEAAFTECANSFLGKGTVINFCSAEESKLGISTASLDNAKVVVNQIAALLLRLKGEKERAGSDPDKLAYLESDNTDSYKDIADAADAAAKTATRAANQEFGQNIYTTANNCSINPATFKLLPCVNAFLNFILYLFIQVIAGFLWVTGMALDKTIDLTVFHMAEKIAAMPSIDVVWRIVRDIINLSFIFILLYVAIQTILDIKSANAKRTLINIIIAAILINFSLFITKVIIDFSNILALAFYGALPGTGSLSSKFVNILQVSQDWKDGSTLLQSLAVIVTLFFAAFTFLAAAWLFIIRFVVVLFLLMLSPIGFAASILPQTASYGKRWREALVGQALFPPLYMFFTWLALTVGASTTALSPSTNAKAAFETSSASNSAIGGLIRYIVILALLNAALIIAKSQSNKSGKVASSVIKWGTDRIDKARTTIRKGTQGYIGRGATRITGVNYADSKFKKTAFANTRIGQSIRKVTTGALTGAKFGSKYSIDDVEKENKKLRESYAKEQVKDVEKKFDKELPQKREELIAQHERDLRGLTSTAAGTEGARYEAEIRARQAAAARQDRLAHDARLSQRQKDNAARLARQNQDRARTLQEERQRKITDLERKRAEVRVRADNKQAANDEEKRLFLAPMQTARAEKLSREKKTIGQRILHWIRPGIGARNEAAKQLRDKARGKKASNEQILDELLTAREATGGAAPATPPTPPTPPATP
jgi:hypothetical protein